MRFGSPDKWWGDMGRRDFPHEGIDLCLYADRSGCVHQLGPDTRIPALQAGSRPRSVFRDYLGKAIVIAHAVGPETFEKVVSIYAHTRPLKEDGARPCGEPRRRHRHHRRYPRIQGQDPCAPAL